MRGWITAEFFVLMGTRISPLWFLACEALFSFGTPRLGAFAAWGRPDTIWRSERAGGIRSWIYAMPMAIPSWLTTIGKGTRQSQDSDQRLCAAE